MPSSSERSEIAFFDVETTVPTRPGQQFAILEFGSILVCPRKLVELDSYSTLVCPADLSLISSLSVRCNGINKDAVVSAPTFAEIADKVYDVLHGRIWAGHNILRFDCARIREAFSNINRPAPEPKGTIDSLALLTQKFGRRAGDMKMASLATYFGLGQQKHRSLDDVRMNLEVVKYCATVLFLESSLPDIFTENSWVSPNATTRSRSNDKSSPVPMGMSTNIPSSSVKLENNLKSTLPNHILEGNHPIFSLMTPSTIEEAHDQVESNSPRQDPFNLGPISDEIERTSVQSDDSMDQEEPTVETRESSTGRMPEVFTLNSEFIEPDEVHVPSISVILAPFFRGTQKLQILHRELPLQVRCRGLKVRFGISSRFVDYAGRPRLNFVVDATPNLCKVLDASDNLAQRLSSDSGSNSEWRPVVTRKPGFFNSPSVRLHLPNAVDGDTARWVTDIYLKESSSIQRLVFSRFDGSELDALFSPGTSVDAYLSLDTYNYQQSAGIRLVAKKLIVHSKN